MEFYLIRYIEFLCLVQISNTQYPNYYDRDEEINPYYPIGDDEYPNAEFRLRNYRRPHSSGGKLPTVYEYPDYSSEESDECNKCKCSKCENPKPCCQQTCITCPQQNLLLVPYPYPLVVKITTNTTSKTTTTTTTTTTEAQKVTESHEDTDSDSSAKMKDRQVQFNDLVPKRSQRKNAESQYILTSLRKTKTNWLPRFGIVPIPDQLAESLMSQMRSMKGINSHKD